MGYMYSVCRVAYLPHRADTVENNTIGNRTKCDTGEHGLLGLNGITGIISSGLVLS